MQSFGINVDDDVAAEIEDRRITVTDDGSQEIRSRSEVCNELLKLGLVAADTLDTAEIDVPAGHPRTALLRQAILDQLRDEHER